LDQVIALAIQKVYNGVTLARQKGMQAEQELSITEIERAASIWLSARDSMVDHVNQLLEVGVHKQIANRLLEPFMYHTVIVTATEWANFFHLRAHKDAQPEIQKIARMMKELYEANTPKQLRYGEWHLPLLQPNECVIDRNSPEWDEPVGAERTIFDIETAKKVSAGRCARVSYLTHDGVRDSKADIELCEKLAEAGHMSPLEHVARPMRPSETLMFSNSMKDSTAMFGNFRGWMQFRKEFANEWDVLGGK